MYYHKNLNLTFSVFQLTFVTNTFKYVNMACVIEALQLLISTLYSYCK